LRSRRGPPAWCRRSITRRRRQRSRSAASASAGGSNGRWGCRSYAPTPIIDPIPFEHFIAETGRGMEFDVMLEAKAKDLALLRLREQLADRTEVGAWARS
jgi:hypothetical protein